MSLINLRTFQSTVQGIQITRGDVHHRPTVQGWQGPILLTKRYLSSSKVDDELIVLSYQIVADAVSNPQGWFGGVSLNDLLWHQAIITMQELEFTHPRSPTVMEEVTRCGLSWLLG